MFSSPPPPPAPEAGEGALVHVEPLHSSSYDLIHETILKAVPHEAVAACMDRTDFALGRYTDGVRQREQAIRRREEYVNRIPSFLRAWVSGATRP
jgi:hypothetical protein